MTDLMHQSLRGRNDRINPLVIEWYNNSEIINTFTLMKQCATYFITNKNNSVLYIGVTSNLEKRVLQHKTKFYPKSFTARYNCNKLVYFEIFSNINDAIFREKQLKKRSRKYKNDLVNKDNPNWNDLSDGWLFTV